MTGKGGTGRYGVRNTGILSVLVAAALFGASTPFAKLLLDAFPLAALAGLLYAASGVGLLSWFGLRRLLHRASTAREAPLTRHDLPWLAGAVVAGGVVAPVLLMLGLAATPAASAALLLNLEGVFTALLAWFVFRENFDRRIALGMGLIVLAGVLLSWGGWSETRSLPLGTLAIAAACLGWAIDNNLTRKVSAADPVQIAGIKGLVAGTVNLGIAMVGGWTPPPASALLAGAAVGLLGYGISLALFVHALRNLGTARTGAYFSTAPFIGAGLSLIMLHETPHEHDFTWDGRRSSWRPAYGCTSPSVTSTRTITRRSRIRTPTCTTRTIKAFCSGLHVPHTHYHEHRPLVHSHPHYPDIHHRHRH